MSLCASQINPDCYPIIMPAERVAAQDGNREVIMDLNHDSDRWKGGRMGSCVAQRCRGKITPGLFSDPWMFDGDIMIALGDIILVCRAAWY